MFDKVLNTSLDVSATTAIATLTTASSANSTA